MSFQESSVYRFGAFEFDTRTGELRKDGMMLKLQDQPRQVLVRLLEHPGAVIHREQLRALLWPENTFVDFDSGLNTAIKRLRDTLGDSAENPIFIQTIPRKGYKFIAPVEAVERNGHKASVAPVPVAPQGRNHLPLIAMVCAAGLVLVLALVIWRSAPRELKVSHVVQLTQDGKGKLATNQPVTDGVHLYFVEGTPWAGASRIAQVSVAGGETTQIETPLNEILAIQDIAPDFSELLIGNGVPQPELGRAPHTVEVWGQPLPAGTPHRVGDIYATDACYTPDGTRIVYADGHSLISVNRDGSNPRQLADVEGTVRRIRFSPDGKRMRFDIVAWPYDTSAIWEMEANGNNLHRLFPNWKEAPFQCCGNWSRDGKYYFFEARNGNDQAIWYLREHRLFARGSQERPSRLIAGPLRLSTPLPATDGKRLFITGEEPRVEPLRLHKESRRVDWYLGGMSVESFDISRDGKWTAYVSYPDLTLWRSRTDGSEKMQLTFPPVRVFAPRWSPDGSAIVFTNIQFDHAWTAGLVSSSGGPVQSFPGTEPGWLPDGHSIIYGDLKPGDPTTLEIFRRDLKTGRSIPIPGSEKKYSPRVSPDGRYICAFSQPATELLLFDLETGRWSSLAKGGMFGYDLWSRSGKYVYMHDTHGGSPRLVRVRIRDAKLEEVLNLRDFPQPAGQLSNWFGLTSDDDPVLIRDRSTQEIYALELQ